MTIDASNSAGLIEALTQLRTTFAQDTTLPADHRNEAVEVINETISIAGQLKPPAQTEQAQTDDSAQWHVDSRRHSSEGP